MKQPQKIRLMGRQAEFLTLPPHWRLASLADCGPEAESQADALALARRALEQPVGCPPLSDLVSPDNRVAVLVEDLTRNSPKREVLTALVHELGRIGVPDENISVIIALGTHRPLSAEELRGAFGQKLLDRLAFYNHDCRSQDLKEVSRLAGGQPVRINRRAAEADFLIGIGSIFPHPMNGFGGGGKILFPGVADFASICEHHMALSFAPGAELGRLDGNPFHQEIARIAHEAGLDFLVNSVLDLRDNLAGVVAGAPDAAHRAGIEKSKRAIARPFSGLADVTITTSFPYDEGPQIIKPLLIAAKATKKGGSLILLADLAQAMPEPLIAAFESFRRRFSGNLGPTVRAHFDDRRLLMADGAVDFNMALGLALDLQHDYRVVVISRDMPPETIRRLGFVPARDLAEAFGLAGNGNPNPTCHVIAAGGMLLPEIVPASQGESRLQGVG